MNGKIFIGTKQGLYIFEKADHYGGRWVQQKHILGDSWISSINVCEDATYITTHEGDVYSWLSRDSESETHLIGRFQNHRAWVIHTDSDESLFLGTTPPRLYRSDDGGTSWNENKVLSQMIESKKWRSHSGRAHLHSICSSTEGMFIGVEVGGVLSSTDRGETWQDITYNLDPDVHKIVIAPDYAVYAATGSGLYRHYSGNREWESVFNLPLKYVQGLVATPKKNEVYVSCARLPFGRFGKETRKNEFAVYKITEDGAMPLGAEASRTGILSKALAIGKSESHPLVMGFLDGSVYLFENIQGSDELQRIVSLCDHIECVELL